MGGAASVTNDFNERKKRLTEGGLSNNFRKMQADGMNEKEIYQNLRETYGSLRLNKKLTVQEGSVRALAIVQLSQTLNSNRCNSGECSYNTPGHSNVSVASETNRRFIRKVHSEKGMVLKDEEKVVTTTSPPKHSKPKSKPKLKILISTGEDEDSAGNGTGARPQKQNSLTPRGSARLSPSGMVHIDGFAIHEKGIIAEDGSGTGTSFLTSGRSDFVMIGSLGRGASGSVIEALHIPTLTIVALKMLPVFGIDDLQHISSELSVLYQNLAELRLIDNRLDDDPNDTEPTPAAFSGRSAGDDEDRGSVRGGSDAGSTPKGAPSVVLSSCKQVLAMYDAFLDTRSGMVNLVVEYMDGGSLQDVVDNGGCQDEEALADIAYQVLLGLEFLHRNRQMHRDIKPGNILLNCNGEVKLADFGISKAVDTKSGFNQPNSFVGTMCYMAPERISNDSYGTPGDIWSFGLTILAVVRGAFPLVPADTSFSYWDLLRIICEEEVPELGPQYSVQFNMFISACLQKDPKDRPTVPMLLQHPFFVQHAKVVSRLSEIAGRPICLTEAVSNSDDEDLFYMSPSVSTDGHGGCRTSFSSANGESKQTRLSRLTSRTRSYAAHATGALLADSSSAVVIGGLDPQLGPYSPSGSLCDSDPDEDVMTAVRLEHLQRVLEKTEAKYDQVVASYRQEKLERKEQHMQNTGSSKGNGIDRQDSCEMSNSAVGSGSSFRSMRSTRSFLKSVNDPMTPVPNFRSGLGKWEHLAYQLQLPVVVVLSTAANILNKKYLARDT